MTVIPDGTYVGDGMFASFDGSESYPTAWQLTQSDGEVALAQLVAPGGRPFQTAQGIADPNGVLVGVIDEQNLCEVLLLPVDNGMPSSFLFIAYGDAGMNCPTDAEVAQAFGVLIDDPLVLQTGLPEFFGWDDDVTTGLARIPNWGMQPN